MLVVVIKFTVDEDTPIAEFYKVSECCAVKDRAVGEAPSRTVAPTFIYLSLVSSLPVPLFEEFVVICSALSAGVVVVFVIWHGISYNKC